MMQSFTHDGLELKYKTLGDPQTGTAVIWAHGWGMTHESLIKIAQSLEPLAYHIVIDFPGFGASPAPTAIWAPADYAAFMAEFIRSLRQKNVVWVGHSFGCRVGVNLAARNPDLIHGMALIAAAGLPRKRSLPSKLYFKFRIALYKFMKRMIRWGLSETWLKSKFGSADYKNAGAMRDILVKTINEDLSDVAPLVRCKTLLIFGAHDDQTPPEMGERYRRYIRGAELVVLEGFDHYTILTDGQHQLARMIKPLITENHTV